MPYLKEPEIDNGPCYTNEIYELIGPFYLLNKFTQKVREPEPQQQLEPESEPESEPEPEPEPQQQPEPEPMQLNNQDCTCLEKSRYRFKHRELEKKYAEYFKYDIVKLNKIFKMSELTPEEQRLIKKIRRTVKNRFYARNSRMKQSLGNKINNL
tara:strand:- start:12 stop:473 length:462 start_codon:yes stop_codon:yes gene_type:complete